ncbi:MAG: methyltransferase type 11 [Clostridiales bacterium]|nr:methyltransferase type 11 [Clostridiales bacterium]
MDKEILTMEEAAELFGVSVKTFIKLLKEEKVPARKIGREWRFSRKALIEWLSAGDSQTYSSSDTEAREFFNEVAHNWEEIRKNYYDESIKNKLMELKLLKKGMTALDLGSGDGYIARSVAKYVKKVYAVDISSEMLKELRKKAAESGIKNIETIETEVQVVPLEASSVDIAFASMFLHHMEDPEIAIKEMGRVLKQGGIAVVTDFYTHSDQEMKKNMHDIWSGFDSAEITKWFMNNGFKDIHIETIKEEINNTSVKNRPEIFILQAYR